MRPRRCSRGLGQSLSARVLLPPGARALAQCEHAENTRFGVIPVALANRRSSVRRSSPAAVARAARETPRRPSYAPTLEPSTRRHLRASEEEQSQQKSAPHSLLGHQEQSERSPPFLPAGPRILPTRNRPTSTHERNPPAVIMCPMINDAPIRVRLRFAENASPEPSAPNLIYGN